MYMFIVLFGLVLLESVLALSIDQRQTGDLNVQIDLKNFNVFTLTKGKEEYVDYDYAYDYSEMTIKPQNGTTTIKPLNTTGTEPIDKNATTPAPTYLTTKHFGSNESDETSTTESIVTVNVSSSTTATSTIGLEVPTKSNATTVNPGPANLDCKKGFFRNTKGNCELMLQNPSNTLLKMLQQKHESSGGNGIRQS